MTVASHKARLRKVTIMTRRFLDFKRSTINKVYAQQGSAPKGFDIIIDGVLHPVYKLSPRGAGFEIKTKKHGVLSARCVNRTGRGFIWSRKS